MSVTMEIQKKTHSKDAPLDGGLQQRAQEFWDLVERTAFPVGANYQVVLSELAKKIIGTEPVFMDMFFQGSLQNEILIGEKKEILPNDGKGTLVSAILYLTGTDENAAVVIFTGETEVYRPAVSMNLQQMGLK